MAPRVGSPSPAPSSRPSASKLTDRQIQRLCDTLLEVADGVLASTAFCAVAAEVEDEFGSWSLRIFVERKEQKPRISLDECAKLSAKLMPVVETLPEIQTLQYQLEVSSPGLFRSLKTQRELSFYVGQPVQVIAKVDGKGKPIDVAKAPPFRKGLLTAYDVTAGELVLEQGVGKASARCV
jgi:ribosome maturation factor RimP